MAKKEQEYEFVERTFNVVLVLKALFAVSEVVGGIAMIFLTPQRLQQLIHWVTQGRLHGNLNDFFIKHLLIFGQHFTGSSQWVAAIYLLSHGLIKFVVIFFLWRRILRAYPISIVVIALFIVYQLYDIITRHSITMGLATVVDIAMIVLTIMEYRRMKGAW